MVRCHVCKLGIGSRDSTEGDSEFKLTLHVDSEFYGVILSTNSFLVWNSIVCHDKFIIYFMETTHEHEHIFSVNAFDEQKLNY